MKIKLCILLIFAAFSVFGQTITFDTSKPMPPKAEYDTLDHYLAEVIYQLEFMPDSNNREYTRQEAMVLHLGQQVSRFMSHNAFRGRMAMKDIDNWDDAHRFVNDPNSQWRSTFHFEIFHNLPQDSLTTHDRVFTDKFVYHEPLYPFSWELTGQVDTLLGYAVQQARTRYGGREWVAWFAPSLPFRAGPYKFGGLPGLILKLHDTQHHYVFSPGKITAFETPGAIAVSKTPRIAISRELFWQTWHRFQKDVGAITRDLITDPSPGTQQRIEQNMRRRNNAIELVAP